MANGSRVSLPQGFDLDAMKAREALTFDDIRDIAKSLRDANKAPRPQAPGRVANVFRRRGQWSSAWWQSATDTDG